MTSVNRWRVFCSTEASYQYWWLSSTASEPTTCPNDSAHTLSGTSTIVETIDKSVVQVSQELVETGSHYLWSTQAFTALANATTTHSFSYPFPTSLLCAQFISREENVGDTWTWTIAENGVIGTITSPVALSDTVINVSSTVFSVLAVGFHMNLFNGVNTAQLGRVLSMDSVAGTVTVETPSSFAFSIPTYVRMAIIFMKDSEIGAPGEYKHGATKIQSSTLPINVIVRIHYTNKSLTTDKRIVCNVELLY
jgi:hypothetical protein